MTHVPATRLIAEARKLCGVSWKHQGRSLAGVDCIGLVILAGRNAGVDFFSSAGIKPVGVYGRKPARELIALVERHCCRADENTVGSLLVFHFPRDDYPRHFGILTDCATVIHAESKTRKRVIEHGYRAHWLRWTHSRWKLPGIDYGR